MKSYLVTFGFSQYLVQHSMNDTEGKKQLFTVTYCFLVSDIVTNEIRPVSDNSPGTNVIKLSTPVNYECS
jgi:hypothetical protein